ncbi:hypothetical protein GGR56DRAFT_234762 [Xylariaceae sp. FL0804]|nr:hypothetical protein GGR56DRAFT_234762 [Xylariaceae sp. FL0804]
MITNSSEAAYYTGSPVGEPQDVAVVTTGAYEDWANNTSKAYFNDTGITFAATLRAQGQNGDFAGTGFNGYRDFNCWQNSTSDVYTHGDQVCSMVYDCSHDSVDSSTSTTSTTASPSSSSTTSATASTTGASTTTPSASPSAAGNNNGGLSIAGTVGISVGVSVGALLLLSVAALLLWRRLQKRRAKAAELPGDGGDDDEAKGGVAHGVKEINKGSPPTELAATQIVPELGIKMYNTPEVHGEALRGELGDTARFELATPDTVPSPGRGQHGQYSPF